MRGKMPESIRTAKLKIGFNSPMPEWLNGPLQPWVNNLIYDKEIKHHDLINMKKFSSFVEENSLSRSWNWGNCESAWRILNYLWFEKKFLSSNFQ
jgi:asparagine synthase (glutamine-hydrolysing)